MNDQMLNAAEQLAAPKADDGKPRLDLVAPDLLDALGHVLAFGARKYGAWSWTRGKAWSRDYAAVLRHLNAWWSGEDLDHESELSHLWHAATDLMLLLVSQRRGLGTDDRPFKDAAPYPREVEHLAHLAGALDRAARYTSEPRCSVYMLLGAAEYACARPKAACDGENHYFVAIKVNGKEVK